MTDRSSGQQGSENTPEKVALDLLHIVAHLEKRALHSDAGDGWTSADRDWLLDTYAECIRTIREPHSRDGGLSPVAPALTAVPTTTR